MGSSNSKSSKKDKKNAAQTAQNSAQSANNNSHNTPQNAANADAAVHKRDKKGKGAGKKERPVSMPGATLDFPSNFSARPNPEGDISGRRPGKYQSELVSTEFFFFV
jgi:hypothetical protein